MKSITKIVAESSADIKDLVRRFALMNIEHTMEGHVGIDDL